MKISTKIITIALVTLLVTTFFFTLLTIPVEAQGRYRCPNSGDGDCNLVNTCEVGCIPPPGACSGDYPDCWSGWDGCICGEIVNPIVGTSGTATSLVQKVIVNLVNLAYIAGVLIFFFMLIIGGLQWIASGGDKMAVSNARSRILHAIIGLLVLMAVFVIVRMVEEIFGVDLLKIDVGLISL